MSENRSIPYMKSKDFISILREEAIDREKQAANEKRHSTDERRKLVVASESVLNSTLDKRVVKDKYASFVESAKAYFLQEAIYNLFSKSVVENLKENNESVMRGLVSAYIREEGASQLLNKMKYKSLYLSDMATLIKEETERVIDCCDQEDPSTFTISTDIKDDFLDKLSQQDDGDVTQIISDRITASVEDFLNRNNEDKEQIKAIVDATKEKTDKIEDEAIAESYSNMAKAKISDIRSRSKSLLEQMVLNLSKSVFKNDVLKEEYFSENKLNMSKIIERTTVVYAFLETLNTSKLAKIDEAYVKEVLDSLAG